MPPDPEADLIPGKGLGAGLPKSDNEDIQHVFPQGPLCSGPRGWALGTQLGPRQTCQAPDHLERYTEYQMPGSHPGIGISEVEPRMCILIDSLGTSLQSDYCWCLRTTGLMEHGLPKVQGP